MKRQHGLYKFVTRDTNEIIYIGKSNSNIRTRILSHINGKGLDKKFNNYKDNYEIYVAFLPNTTETDIMERILINQYKPVLNITDNFEGFNGLITVKEPKWIKYDEALSELLKAPQKVPEPQKFINWGYISIGCNNGIEFWIEDAYEKRIDGKTKIIENTFSSKENMIECLKETVLITKKYGIKKFNEEFKTELYMVSEEYIKNNDKIKDLWTIDRNPALQKHDNNSIIIQRIMENIRTYDDKTFHLFHVDVINDFETILFKNSLYNIK